MADLDMKGKVGLIAILKSIPFREFRFGDITISIYTLFFLLSLTVLITLIKNGPEYEHTSLDIVLPPVHV
jgi:hypothetical protein